MDWLRKVINDPRTERFIVALIVIKAVTLGLETSHSAMARYGPLLNTIDRLIIAIFVIEIFARFAVQGRAFFRDGWTAPLMREIKGLKAEIASLRADLGAGKRP
jgi:voltage-gated sodium channel